MNDDVNYRPMLVDLWLCQLNGTARAGWFSF